MNKVKNFMRKIMGKKMEKASEKLQGLKEDEKGMELLQIIVVCLLVVVLGGILLNYFTGAFNDIGALMVAKIKTIFSL